jgi:hypothetical protein
MNPLRAWKVFWFTSTSARPLAAFRIVFGLILLANLALLWFDLDYLLTDHGLLVGTEAREVAGALRYSPLQWVQDPTSVRVFCGATALVYFLFTIGWRTRTMGVLSYLMTLSIHGRNLLTNSGADTLLLLLCFYMMLSPCGAAFSLDARRAARRRGTLAEPLILPWAQRLVQVHVSMIYLDTAILKSGGPSWLNGTAMHYVLNNTEFRRLPLDALTQYPVVINLMTHGALLTEFALAFLLWFRATRLPAICAGLALHSAILLTVNIPIFGEMMMASYLLFLTPEEFDRMLRALDPRPWLGREPRRAAVIPGRVDGPSSPAGPHVTAEVREPAFLARAD